MPAPLDADRQEAGPSPQSGDPRPKAGPRPTPVPRTSSEAMLADDALDEELAELTEAGVAPEPGAVDVWGLVRRAQAGDAEAFGELYDNYVTMVHRYVYHRVGDRATAEDVTSETSSARCAGSTRCRSRGATSGPGWSRSPATSSSTT